MAPDREVQSSPGILSGFFGESEKFRAPEHLFIVIQRLVRSLENEG
jgi:hypothetical protein